MSKEIMVYFNSGNKARLSAEKTVFAKDPYLAGLMDMVQDGHMVVNWANVCYIREFEEPKEDDDL